MEQLFKIDLKKINTTSQKESLERKKNFELFLKTGLPNKKDENWKFTDFNSIINKNFKKILNNNEFEFNKKIEIINDFDHNYIVLVNGIFKSCDIQFEDKEKVKIKSLNSLKDFDRQENNNLHFLNKALSLGA